LITLAEVESIEGAPGDFQVLVRQHPRYVDMDKCIACGQCAAKCPKKVDDEYNAGLNKRKAIYVPYSQAVPLKYAIDPRYCIFLEKGRCGVCEKVCPSGAINFKDTEKTRTLAVGSVVLAPGFRSFDPKGLKIYSYGETPNVVTSLEFERILSATGPFGGHLVKPSSGKARTEPKKIAWIQCVGSREINRCDHGYCSSVCCMYAVKQAVMARDHSSGDLECAIFYMDMRTQGKDFDRYMENAKRNGVRFVRARVHSVAPPQHGEDLSLRYARQDGTIEEEAFDVVVLSTGLEISPEVVALAEKLGVPLNADHFVEGDSFDPVATGKPGVFACGAFTGPKDIPHSVMEASAAAAAATESLAVARHSQTHTLVLPKEIDVSGQPPRIGVFVCNCGINIGGVVRVPEVAEYARTLPNVTYVEENLFTCSQDTQDKMAEVIGREKLNRVVVAACTPRTHEPLFQATLASAGLNRYLFEMANIRNQDSWVHANDPDAATRKAKDLVAMAVAKAALLTPLTQTELPMSRNALVVGGGIAGLTAARALARQGFPVHLVEKSDVLGGHGRRLRATWRGEPVGERLAALIAELEADPLVRIYTNAKVAEVEGFVGNFKTVVTADRQSHAIDHGVAILATGAKEYKPREYLYGQHPAVVTQTELDDLIGSGDPRLAGATDVVFIQCVGSRNAERPYCSKVCCTHALRNALAIKAASPDTNIYVLYRDMRTYGLREEIFREARAKGVLFFQYDPEAPPVAEASGDRVRVTFRDHILNRPVTVDADLLALAAAVVSDAENGLAQFFKVPVDGAGWLLEAHQKLRPVDFATDGVFLCGLAHYPKPIDESVSQALAAAARAATFLARDTILVGGVVSWIDPARCTGCAGCVQVCPYNAIAMSEITGMAEVNPALCKGCGACAATCPSEAPILMGFNNRQLYAQIHSALAA
jgi:heterodisulfide reductase subunit A